MQRITLFLVLAGLLVSCRTQSHVVARFDDDGVLVARTESAESTPVEWRLYPGQRRAPRLDRKSSTIEIQPRIGITPSTVTTERADRLGVQPFVGAWIDKVTPGLPASEAGLVKGDIVLSVEGEAVTSSEQLIHLIRTHAVPGEELELEVLVHRQRGEPLGKATSANVVLRPVAHEIKESSTESIELEFSKGVQEYTGLQLAEVPPGLAREIYGEDRSVVVVSGVELGSPAYEAGFRSGDRVLECDSRPVGSLDVVRESVVHRLERDWDRFDLSDAAPANGGGGSDDRLALSVTGELGRHGASLELSDDFRGTTRFYIPIVTDYRSDADSSRLSFLDFIFQFGFNYRSNVYHSPNRKPIETWSLSLFPLGMFEFRKGVLSNEYTFFWLIDFETGH